MSVVLYPCILCVALLMYLFVLRVCELFGDDDRAAQCRDRARAVRRESRPLSELTRQIIPGTWNGHAPLPVALFGETIHTVFGVWFLFFC